MFGLPPLRLCNWSLRPSLQWRLQRTRSRGSRGSRGARRSSICKPTTRSVHWSSILRTWQELACKFPFLIGANHTSAAVGDVARPRCNHSAAWPPAPIFRANCVSRGACGRFRVICPLTEGERRARFCAPDAAGCLPSWGGQSSRTPLNRRPARSLPRLPRPSGVPGSHRSAELPSELRDSSRAEIPSGHTRDPVRYGSASHSRPCCDHAETESCSQKPRRNHRGAGRTATRSCIPRATVARGNKREGN